MPASSSPARRWMSPSSCRGSTTSGTNRILCGLFLASTSSINPQRMRRSEEHTSELQSRGHLVCRLLLEKKKFHHDDIGIYQTAPRLQQINIAPPAHEEQTIQSFPDNARKHTKRTGTHNDFIGLTTLDCD